MSSVGVWAENAEESTDTPGLVVDSSAFSRPQPGDAAYLHRDSGVLNTGDSIFNVLGLRWSIESFCTDFRMSQKTAVRLAELEYSTAAFTHGAHLGDNPREHIRGFLRDKGML